MLQRNFALYDEESVIENVMRAMPDDVDYEESLYSALELLEMVQMNHRITHIARDFLKVFGELTGDGDTHTSCCACDHPHSGCDCEAVEVGHFAFGDLLHLVPGY